MTKREFLDKLKKALANDLSGNVIRDNVDYYNDYITEEVRKGRKESEVIEELGDPWAIAKNIITSEEIKGNTGETYDSYEPEEGRRRSRRRRGGKGSERPAEKPAEKPEEKRREGNRRRRTRSGKPGASAIKPFPPQPDAKPVSRQESQRPI